MSRQVPLLDDDDIVWTKATSENGEPFEIGIRKDDAVLREESQEPVQTSSQWYTYNVHWPVDGQTWKAVNKLDQQRFFIRRYRLFHTPGSVYKYRLEFTNIGGFEFAFVDESGLRLELHTPNVKDYAFRYNSSKPTIVKVAVRF